MSAPFFPNSFANMTIPSLSLQKKWPKLSLARCLWPLFAALLLPVSGSETAVLVEDDFEQYEAGRRPEEHYRFPGFTLPDDGVILDAGSDHGKVLQMKYVEKATPGETFGSRLERRFAGFPEVGSEGRVTLEFDYQPVSTVNSWAGFMLLNSGDKQVQQAVLINPSGGVRLATPNNTVLHLVREPLEAGKWYHIALTLDLKLNEVNLTVSADGMEPVQSGFQPSGIPQGAILDTFYIARYSKPFRYDYRLDRLRIRQTPR